MAGGPRKVSKRASRASGIPGSVSRLLTVAQASVYLGVTEGGLRRWIFQERLPVVRLGRCVRLDKGDLDELIEARKEDPGPCPLGPFDLKSKAREGSS